VDSSFVSSIDLPAESWRRLTLVLGLIAAVEALVILVAGVVLAVRPFAHHLRSASVSSAPLDLGGKEGADSPVGKATLSRGQTVVMVLNGNGRTGAAATSAARLQSIGYRIGTVGDAGSMDYPKSVIMFRRGARPEAVRLAHDLHVHTVGPLDGLEPGQLGRARLVYILGAT
jgi:hypothetical protein